MNRRYRYGSPSRCTRIRIGRLSVAGQLESTPETIRLNMRWLAIDRRHRTHPAERYAA